MNYLLFPVTMLFCSNMFSSSVCAADGDVVENKGKGAVLSLHCAPVSLQELTRLCPAPMRATAGLK